MTIFMSYSGDGNNLCLLHGFTQTHKSWEILRTTLDKTNTTIAPDLPGHGDSLDGAISISQMADQIVMAITKPTVFVGYSFGARLALHIALQHPAQTRALVLVSATAGIEDAKTRQDRVRADESLAQRIIEIGVEAFVDEWLSRDLFASLTPQNNQRSLRLNNTAEGLAASLRYAGTGCQESLWEKLGEIKCPTLILAGEKDAKFLALAHRLHAEIEQSELHILDARHSVHIERPQEFQNLLVDFLERLER